VSTENTRVTKHAPIVRAPSIIASQGGRKSSSDLDRGSMSMTTSTGFLVKGTAWTLGTYGANQVLRLLTNVALARLLAPELFGIMLIVYSLRAGIELVTDIGIGQSIVYNKDADDPDFYNTAWSLGLIRNIVLWLVTLAAAVPVANFYHISILIFILPITTSGLLLGGLTSISRSLLQKRLKIAKLVVFDLFASFISSVGYVVLAYLSPTIWALAFGSLFAPAVVMVGSYFLLPDVKQRFYISGEFARQILHFGKWIFASQLVYFLSTNFDRLYLAKVIPFELLGIYGIARSISELLGGVVMRLGQLVLFPFIASHSQTPRAELRKQLAKIRLTFFLVAALGFSLFVSTADLAIRILYDERYQAATWMLPVLVIGSWFSIMANINEATLLGLGKPSYGAISSSSKFAFLLIGLPLSVKINGLLGAVMIITLADLCRYIPIFVGQRRERFSFGTQDLLATLVVLLLIAFWEWLRWISGFGTSFDTLPIDVSAFFINRPSEPQ
jgi:O-antigen/teichoic acid export membrane protein